MNNVKVAIIDHVGKVVKKDGSEFTKEEFKELYNKMFRLAEADGFEANKTVVTMKRFCELNYNPRARVPLTDKNLPGMKYAMRHQSKPEKVYFICPALYKNIEQEVRKWADRNIPIVIYETKEDNLYVYDKYFKTASTVKNNDSFQITHQYDWDGQYSIMRRIVDIWAPATLSDYHNEMPYIRYQEELVPDNYCKRPDYDYLVESGETHVSKPFTSSAGFLSRTRCIEKESEVKNDFNQIMAYAKYAGGYIVTKPGINFGAFVGDYAKMNEWLNPDFIICENCGRPMKIRKFGESGCNHCNADYEEDVTFAIYYDDAYIYDEDILDDGYDEEYSEEEYFQMIEREE